MTTAYESRVAQPSLSLELSAFINHAMQAVADAHAYRTTVRALKRLDIHTLNDLGINPSTIRAEAHKAVYGV